MAEQGAAGAGGGGGGGGGREDPRQRPMNAEEEKALEALRDRAGGVEADPESTDAALLRFLRARKLDVDKAEEMLRRWRAWRREFGVDGLTASSVATEIRSGKAVWNGRDREGRPLLVVLPRRHFPAERYTMAETTRFAVFTVEQGVRLAEERGASQFCLVYDRGGFGEVNRDRALFTMARDIVDILQSYYAERLQRMYVFHTNWLFWLVFKMVSPLLSAETKAKVHIVSRPDEHPLLQFFDADSLPAAYGGTLPDAYEYRDTLGWARLRPAGGGAPIRREAGGEPAGDAKAVRVKSRLRVELEVDAAAIAAAPACAAAPVEAAGVMPEGGWEEGAEAAAVERARDGVARLVAEAPPTLAVRWSFRTEAHDVSFSVRRAVVAAGGEEEGEETSVWDPRRCRAHDGFVLVTEPCRLVFEFDNSFSYLRSKNVHYEVELRGVEAAGAPAVVDNFLGGGALDDIKPDAAGDGLDGVTITDEEVRKLHAEVGSG